MSNKTIFKSIISIGKKKTILLK